VIYIATAEDTTDRRQAVGRYLSDRGGLKTEQVQIRTGSNPDSYHAAAPELANYGKTDTGSGGGAGMSSASSGH